MGNFFRRTAKVFGIGVLILLLYAGFQIWNGNFHEVIAGEFYRSAQLGPKTLERRIEQYGIKTVLNLRGGSAGTPFYDDEVSVTSKLGVKHINFQMSSRQQLTDAQILQLVDVMREAPKPILVHCLSGADRTGFASVLYLQQIAMVDEETAEWQLSPLYGHINLPFLPAYAMDETWERFEKLLGLDS